MLGDSHEITVKNCTDDDIWLVGINKDSGNHVSLEEAQAFVKEMRLNPGLVEVVDVDANCFHVPLPVFLRDRLIERGYLKHMYHLPEDLTVYELTAEMP